LFGSDAFTVSYFFGTNSLTGLEISYQLLNVLCRAEICGFLCYGIVCDAGGGNSSMFKKTRKFSSETPGNKPWLSDNEYSLPNPVAPSRLLYRFFCLSHVIKAVRNQLHASRNTGSRVLQILVPYGWETVVQCWKREADQIQRTVAKRTPLTPEAVYLEGYLKMRVPFALAVSDRITICEIIENCEKDLNLCSVIPDINMFLKVDKNSRPIGELVWRIHQLQAQSNINSINFSGLCTA
jgi:hypothetical protein